ncbi:MAG: phosphodiester glycosidase family protein [Gemmatimonas sp.]
MPPFVRHAAVLLACFLAGCRAPAHMDARPLTLAATMADSVVTTPVAPGARLHRLVNTTLPWRAFVLEVDLTCSRLQALKGGATAVGRTTTSRLLAALPDDMDAIAAINADFFLFAPPGVPTNLHVERAVMLAGPGPKPVIFTDGRRVQIDSVIAHGRLTTNGGDLRLESWNRPAPTRVGIVDARWGVALDSLERRQVWRLDPLAGRGARAPGTAARLDGRYRVRPAVSADTLVFGDTLLVHLPPPRPGSPAPTMRAGDTVRIRLGLATARGPVRITDAVGGRPIVLADSTITRDVDTEGNAGFRNLNPRSAIGVNRARTRAWLAVIDGRQPGYSMGMTLRQVGELMQALGATHALNLDGGGSSALVLRSSGDTTVRVVNRPSDQTERPVGNALAVLSRCTGT